MGNDREELKNLSTERVSFPPEMAVSQKVWDAVEEWPWHGGVPTQDFRDPKFDEYHRFCGKCLQTVYVISKGGKTYRYTDDEIAGQKLAHLIQRHGWTREAPHAEQ